MKKKQTPPVFIRTQYGFLVFQILELSKDYEKCLSDCKRLNSEVGGEIKFAYANRKKESLKYGLVLLSASILEAMINTWISIKTSEDEFEAFENMRIIDKWTVLPKLFYKKYHVDKSKRTYQFLISIIEMRNFIVHMKPHVGSLNETILHKGNFKEIFAKDTFKPKEYVEQPFHLWTNLILNETDPQKRSVMEMFSLDSELRTINFLKSTD